MTTRTPRLPEEAYAAALASVPKVGPAALRRLLATDAPSVVWARGSFGDDDAVLATWQRHQELGVAVVTPESPDYPSYLRGDPEAPAVLFCKGTPAVLNEHPTVALVGTRSPTRYGIGVAAQFGAELASLGISVVSGLAMGIDGAAHEGACDAGAPPIAVVAGGPSEPYPRRHERLWERVAAQGAVVSESPVGVRTEKWRFPVRNRLMAALSDAVIVVESRYQGGSQHTVDAAVARGIPVGAVPGSIRSPTSVGTNALLIDGCFPVCGISDILVALSLRGVVPNSALPTPESPRPSDLPPSAGSDRPILDALSQDPISLDRLARITGMELPALCGGLERLARAGLARDVGGWWERT
jgi:DNA processing protein